MVRPQDNDSEISKKTVLVLLVLTILVSAFGTLTLLNSIDSSSQNFLPQQEQSVSAPSRAPYAGARVTIVGPSVPKGQVKIGIGSGEVQNGQ